MYLNTQGAEDAAYKGSLYLSTSPLNYVEEQIEKLWNIYWVYFAIKIVLHFHTIEGYTVSCL